MPNMNALLVRIGVDQAYGDWNAPVDAEGRFVYVPIPESPGTRFHPGLRRRFGEVLPGCGGSAKTTTATSAATTVPAGADRQVGLRHCTHAVPDNLPRRGRR